MTTQRFSWIVGAGLALVAGLGAPSSVQAQNVRHVPVLQTLQSPVWAQNPPGDPARLFICEQRAGTTGRVRVFKNGALLPTSFLNVTVSTGGEQGLLGLAFHPQFATNRTLFINYTNTAGTTIIARARASATNPDIAEAGSLLTILTINQDFANHNGGWIAFGPDGYLYIGMGDGGSGDDPNNRAQDVNALLGKILRIDVDGADNIPGNDDDDGVIGSSTALQYTSPPNNPFFGPTAGRDEIWAYGMRNPWRNAFDRLTGNLWIADVGQNNREEVNVQQLGDPFAAVGSPNYQGGRNYGWRCREGLIQNPTYPTCVVPAAVNPLFNYAHSTNIAPTFRTGCSITGGYVYRGSRIPALYGKYVFADYCAGVVMAYDPGSGEVVTLFATGGSVLSFGEDLDGELFYMRDLGAGAVDELQRILPCPADFDGSGGTPDASDIEAFFGAWLAGDSLADVDGSGGVPDASDIDVFFGFWLAGGCAT